jgi:glycine betaine/choline ABC-type transport system substrate-binding protein
MLRRHAVLATLAAVAAASPGCKRPVRPLVVGSKTTIQNAIVAEIAAQHIERRLNTQVERRMNQGGTFVLHAEITSGEIDFYVEQVGAALNTVLKVDMVPDAGAMLERVIDMYRSNYQLEWLPPLGYTTTFVAAVRKEDAVKYKLRTISDLERTGESWTFGFDFEFLSRPDGAKALNSAYSIDYKRAPSTLDEAEMYRALEQKQVDVISARSTDARVQSPKFSLLDDDRSAFITYQNSIVVRLGAKERFPEVVSTLAQLSGKISDDQIRQMNTDSEARKAAPAQIAAAFLATSHL